jgi:hypothetical protein
MKGYSCERFEHKLQVANRHVHLIRQMGHADLVVKAATFLHPVGTHLLLDPMHHSSNFIFVVCTIGSHGNTQHYIILAIFFSSAKILKLLEYSMFPNLFIVHFFEKTAIKI